MNINENLSNDDDYCNELSNKRDDLVDSISFNIDEAASVIKKLKEIIDNDEENDEELLKLLNQISEIDWHQNYIEFRDNLARRRKLAYKFELRINILHINGVNIWRT